MKQRVPTLPTPTTFARYRRTRYCSKQLPAVVLERATVAARKVAPIDGLARVRAVRSSRPG